MSGPQFRNLSVLTLESRRRVELGSIITAYGGRPVSAPAMREVPLESNVEAFAFVEAFVRDEFDTFVSLTGVGLRALLEIAAASVGRDPFVAVLRRVRVAARGPKPLAVLRELDIIPWVVAPSPNTWRELLSAFDALGPGVLSGSRLAVQEYGVSSEPLLDGLGARGALVTRVPVYQYALPDDLGPLQAAAAAIAAGEIDVTIFTTATQVSHLMLVAEQAGVADAVRARFDATTVVASIGPSTSEELREHGIAVDLEASQPKMGALVRDAAEHAQRLLDAKRQS